ncbi:hypothetical protein [Argonema galeatum]|uniref:hypothetical protein n=1 Tax=Argonema galeatum TaxID=2942762 RepID=UPI002012B5EE|nr:hypothetical protein [Argonema galeatum]MCL1467267.1 hypothetical protein [Argonema galeatum A003/A1]
MEQAILNQIIERLQMLDMDELHQLNQAIQTHLADKQKATQKTKFHQALLNSGLVKQVKQPSYSRQTERRLIQVQGKPVSETIIEERR